MFESKKGEKLSLRSSALENAVEDADVILNDLVRTMIEKGQTDGDMTLKIHVTLSQIYDGPDSVISPQFSHDVSSALKIVAKLNGECGMETSATWDDKLGGFMLRRLNDGQTNMYDNYEYEDEDE